MKTYWRVENNQDITLCTVKGGGPIGIVGPIQPTTDMYEAGERGFTAIVLKPGFPAAGPWQQRRQAAEWLQDYVKREWFPEIEFGEIPAIMPREKARLKAKLASANA